jgi:hypothetical protein
MAGSKSDLCVTAIHNGDWQRLVELVTENAEGERQ